MDSDPIEESQNIQTPDRSFEDYFDDLGIDDVEAKIDSPQIK